MRTATHSYSGSSWGTWWGCVWVTLSRTSCTWKRGRARGSEVGTGGRGLAEVTHRSCVPAGGAGSEDQGAGQGEDQGQGAGP